MFQGKLNIPMNLQQINVISAEALEAFLHAFSNIFSIDPQNLRIVSYITWPFWITAYFCGQNNLSITGNTQQLKIATDS